MKGKRYDIVLRNMKKKQRNMLIAIEKKKKMCRGRKLKKKLHKRNRKSVINLKKK